MKYFFYALAIIMHCPLTVVSMQPDQQPNTDLNIDTLTEFAHIIRKRLDTPIDVEICCSLRIPDTKEVVVVANERDPIGVPTPFGNERRLFLAKFKGDGILDETFATNNTKYKTFKNILIIPGWTSTAFKLNEKHIILSFLRTKSRLNLYYDEAIFDINGLSI